MNTRPAILICIQFLFCCCFISDLHSQKSITIDLNSNWEFRKVGDTSGWMPATVPGCVHTDLLANGIIPDPFYSDNEKLVQWVENEDWEYRTTFHMSKKILKNKVIELNFEGLDTYADVYLNDSLILQADNMFRSWNIDVKKYLNKRNNELYIYFHSAVTRGNQLKLTYPITLPGEERVFTRKAQYQYGWDWGPRLVTCGIWKNITLRSSAWKNYDDLFEIFPAIITADSAILGIRDKNGLLKSGNYTLQIKNIQTGDILYDQGLQPNLVQLSASDIIDFNLAGYFKIDNPQLWWCNGLGTPYLYDLKISLISKNKIVYTKSIKIGLRTIELINHPDQFGNSFYISLNGTPVFCKGANIIPLNSFPATVTKEDYNKLLYEAKQMNFNMVRIWGGGIYEDDYFYNLCDSLGIIVWQDLMFACAIYPFGMSNAENNTLPFTINSSKEISQQVNRIGKHPCSGLWCGNNEIDEGLLNWGWQRQYQIGSEDSAYLALRNRELFHNYFQNLMPDKVGNSNYHPSSPEFGWGHPESLTQGDCHYWGVWWGHEPFEVYNEKIPRFMSEYGFQGMPSIFSFRQFIPENELSGNAAEVLQSPSIKNHQKHPTGYETIQEYMNLYYGIPENFEDYIYVSQLLQARAMQTAIEAHRRNMPYCMGTLFWQFNDCWPVTSWSVIDYYGNRKAAYYTVKEKYKPVMLSAIQKNDSVAVWLVNDQNDTLLTTITYRLMKTDGRLVSTFSDEIRLSPGSSQKIRSFNASDLAAGINPADLVLFVYADDVTGGVQLATTSFEFLSPKDMEYFNPQIEITSDPDSHEIFVRVNGYAKNLYLYLDDGELKLDKNYFDAASEMVTIHVEGEWPADLQNRLRFKCLNTISSN